MYIKDFDIDIDLDDLQKAIYQQGRADANEVIKPVMKDIHDNVYEQGKKDGRAEAINEFMEELEKYEAEINNTENKPFSYICFVYRKMLKENK